MKHLLNDLIGQNQCTFISSRSIHDNITIAYELAHTMYNFEAKSSLALIKLNLTKPFDSMGGNHCCFAAYELSPPIYRLGQ